MTLTSLFAVLVSTTLLTAPALAQDTSGPNVDPTGTGTRGGVAALALAQDLYALGLANQDALTVLTAARLAASVDVKDVEQTVSTEGPEAAEQQHGTEAPVDTPVKAPVDTPVEAATMLAAARTLAGEDEVLAGLIEDAEAQGARGRISGASRSLSRLPAGRADIWKIPFYGKSYAELAVVGDGGSNLDVVVTDENGNTICHDVSWSDKVYCDFVPAWNGYFHVRVENSGHRRNTYYLLTN